MQRNLWHPQPERTIGQQRDRRCRSQEEDQPHHGQRWRRQQPPEQPAWYERAQPRAQGRAHVAHGGSKRAQRGDRREAPAAVAQCPLPLGRPAQVAIESKPKFLFFRCCNFNTYMKISVRIMEGPQSFLWEKA